MNTFEIIETEIQAGIIQYQIKDGHQIISYQDWIRLIKSSAEFMRLFLQVLSDCPYEAYFWEVKPVAQSTRQQAFEFVLVESTLLPKMQPNSQPFEAHFREGKDVVHFPNLRGDAQLIVPTNISAPGNYGHLANFIRYAPDSQVVHLWEKVARVFDEQISTAPKWLSTAGLGVNWLHIRIDSRPKYYRYAAYK